MREEIRAKSERETERAVNERRERQRDRETERSEREKTVREVNQRHTYIHTYLKAARPT